MYKWWSLFLLLPFCLNGQAKFTFGIRSHVNFSQVDGDNLTGFSKIGFDLGIEGGYIISPSSRIIFGQSLTKLGSSSKRPDVEFGDYVALVDLFTANLLLGYSHHFNLGWDDSRSYSFQFGLKYHYVIRNNSILIFNSFDAEPPLNLDDIKDRFASIHVGISRKINNDIKVELFGEYGVNYLLDSESNRSSKLIPYLLSLGFAYQI